MANSKELLSLAQAKNYEKLRELITTRQNTVHQIALIYALDGKHDKVEEYRIVHHASVDAIVKGYAQGGNHAKVEEYRTKYQASVHLIAQAYAEAGNHDKVEEYRTKHQASVHEIARGYAKVANHDKMEEYRTKHQAEINSQTKIFVYSKLSDVLAPQSVPGIQGGIHTKYTTGSPHPRLPKSQKAVNDTSSMHHKLPLTPVCNMSLASGSFYTHSIATPAFGAKLFNRNYLASSMLH